MHRRIHQDLVSSYDRPCNKIFCFVSNQKPKKEKVVDQIFCIWIKIFGYSQKIIVDNGSEFDNTEFRDFCQNLNTEIKITAAESPWCNGVVEQYNGIIEAF